MHSIPTSTGMVAFQTTSLLTGSILNHAALHTSFTAAQPDSCPTRRAQTARSPCSHDHRLLLPARAEMHSAITPAAAAGSKSSGSGPGTAAVAAAAMTKQVTTDGTAAAVPPPPPPPPPPPAGAEVVRDLPQVRVHGGAAFPLVLRPAQFVAPPAAPVAANTPLDLAAWATAQADAIERAVSAHGALLLRGWTGPAGRPLVPADLAAFVAALRRENFPYIGGNAVRHPVPGTDNRVFTANESPPERPIPFHHELAQTPDYPRAILFFCEHPAEADGETPIVLSTAVYEMLRAEHPAFMAQLSRHGVVYSRIMTAHDRPESAIGRGWRATFQAETQADVERALADKGYSWQWLDPENPASPAPPGTVDPLLREMSPVLDAVKPVMGGGLGDDKADADGRKAFFNQLVAVWGGWRDAFNSPEDCVRSGDGSKLDPVAMAAAQRITRELSVAIPWQAGDIMFLDNMQVQHARNTFTGKRRVLASLTR